MPTDFLPGRRRVAPALAAAVIACSCRSLPLDEREFESQGGVGGMTAAPPLEQRVMERVVISSDAAAEHHQQASASVDFGDESVIAATLHVELESPCFPFDSWSLETIPDGHNWPS